MDPQNQYNSFTNLPYQTVIVILKKLLKQDDGIEIFDRLFNMHNYHIINCLLLAQNKKSLCLMDTRSWIMCLYSMGYDGELNTFNPENRRYIWDKSNIAYQKNVIDNYLYTSRVHDLIDCLREGNQIARSLLQRLYNQTTDPYERAFLLGRQPVQDRIQFTNDTLSNYLDHWIRGIIIGPTIKYWDVRDVTNMSRLFEVINGVTNIN